MKRFSLRIFATEAISSKTLEALSLELAHSFAMIHIVGIAWLEIPEKAWNARRGQVFGPSLLNHLRKRLALGEMGLWIVNRDLYTPRMNWIFGQARKGMGAVLSVARLGGSLDFATKEAIHEMGHVLGLDHCQLPCVMTFSNSVAEAQLKSPCFCKRCLNFLRNLNPDHKLTEK